MSALCLLLLWFLLLLHAAIQDTLTAAFQQRPFSTAAVCEAAVRGAARNNHVPAGGIRMFASLATNACYEVAERHNSLPPSSSAHNAALGAALTDSSNRDALLLQFGLITMQLKYTISSSGSTSVFSGLFHHVMPTCRAVVSWER